MEALEFGSLIERCRRELAEPAGRATAEYGVGELEQVLGTPAGPIRIPEGVTIGDGAHVDRLRFAMKKDGEQHLRARTRGNMLATLVPVASGVIIGLSAATTILMFW